MAPTVLYICTKNVPQKSLYIFIGHLSNGFLDACGKSYDIMEMVLRLETLSSFHGQSLVTCVGGYIIFPYFLSFSLSLLIS